MIATGTASLVTDPRKKQEGLACILRHYGAGEHAFPEKELERVCVVRIAVGEMTGKQYGC